MLAVMDDHGKTGQSVEAHGTLGIPEFRTRGERGGVVRS